MSLIHNERTKLAATCLNTLTVATVTTGIITPLVAITLGMPASGIVSPMVFTLASILWLMIGISLHLSARYVLGRLKG